MSRPLFAVLKNSWNELCPTLPASINSAFAESAGGRVIRFNRCGSDVQHREFSVDPLISHSSLAHIGGDVECSIQSKPERRSRMGVGKSSFRQAVRKSSSFPRAPNFSSN